MVKKLALLSILISVSITKLFCQVILPPAIPTSEQSVTLIFDATGTPLAGESKIYMHSGVVTTNTASPGGNDWKFVKGNWGKDDGVGLMTKVTGQANQWQIALSPSIRQFYNVPVGTNVFWLALVFRNANGSKQTSPDIFKPLTAPAFVSINSPTLSEIFIPLGGAVTISGTASAQATSMEILVDQGSGFVSKATAFNAITISTQYTPVGSSVKIKIKAIINTISVETVADYTFKTRPIVVDQSLPTGIKDGINYSAEATKVTLVLLAPGKEFVYAVGDFTNWELNDSYFMKRTPDGERFWLEITGLVPGQEYVFQYWVEGTIKVGDPLADKVADPFNDSSIPSTTYPSLPAYNKTQYGIASVLQTNQAAYNWAGSETTWVSPDKKELVIYEVLLRDFIGSRRFKDLADSLFYFKRLGINAIELMPIMEFEGNLSWGYNPSYFLAPDKFYGTKNDLKHLVEKAHEQGIAIIMDMVLNHAFGQNAMVQMYFNKNTNKPAANSPWFNVDATHPYNVGYDFNHESQYTKNFVDTVCSYWLAEYHIDGFRFDLSKGFTQKNNPNDVGAWGAYDASRINILTRMATEIWKTKSNAYVILEHFADSAEEQVLANNGMLLWGNMTGTYASALGGNNNASLSSANRLNYVNYLESHDEERLLVDLLKNGQSGGSYSIKDLDVALNRAKMGAAFFYTLPGPKMLWQFGELGYDKSINFCANGSENSNCRLDNKPLPWGTGSLNYYTNTNRQRLYKTIAAINKLVKTNNSVFKSGSVTFDATGNGRTVKITSPEMDVVIVGNFLVSYQSIAIVFPKTGTWFDYFGNESVIFPDQSQTIFMAPGEFHIYTTVQQPSPGAGLVDFLVTATEVTDREISVFPNPVSANSLTIDLGSTQSKEVSIELYDVSGRMINRAIQTSVSNTIQYDTGSLSAGVYFLILDQHGNRKMKKIIIN